MIIICLLIIILCVAFTLLATVDDMKGWVDIICVIGLAVSMFGIITCVPSIIITHCNTNKKIYTKQLEYESLVKQCQAASSEYENISKVSVIKDVYEWNEDVYNAKYWSKSSWTNWFFNQKVVDSLEYINLKDYGL